jgi:deazaflavin-dependent oxidoreductase (nitroreductase family)
MEDWSGEQFCYLTTTGRRSARPHTIEIWFGSQNGLLYLLSGNPHSDWVANLRSDPNVLVRVAGQTDRPALARVVEDPEEDAAARRLLARKYQDWREGLPLSSWARTALPVRIELNGE